MKPYVFLGIFVIIMAVGFDIKGTLSGWQAPGICIGVIVALSIGAYLRHKFKR